MLEVINKQLDLLADSLTVNNYPGYPLSSERLVMSVGNLAITDHLPTGSWETISQPLPTKRQQAEFDHKGFAVDALGRPLHPWLNDMVSRPDVGVVTGRGAYYYWGPNYTADAVVIKEDHVLLIQRGDTGLWALPGGFVDDGELPELAARRETAEETNVTLQSSELIDLVYRGPVVDLRATAHAWPETTAFLYVPKMRAEAIASDDAQQARWTPLSELKDGSIALFGAHNFLLNQGLAQLRK